MGQPNDHLLDTARETFPQPSRVNGDADGPGRPGIRTRGGSDGHAAVNAVVGIALGSGCRRRGREPAAEA